MSTVILLIRHGLTDWNEQRRWQGHEDVPLNATGIAQAEALAERLAVWPINTIYSSDLRRAAQTAEILGNRQGLKPRLDPSWRERDVGQFQGLTHEEIKVKFPKEWSEMILGVVQPPGGEDNHHLYARSVAAFTKVSTHHQDEMVAVVSHGGILHATLLHILNIPIGDYGRLSLRGNTGISIVEINNGQSRLIRLNDTGHLEKDGLGPPF